MKGFSKKLRLFIARGGLAGMLALAGITALHPEESMEDFRSEWFDKLSGGTATREAFRRRAFSEMFASWIEGQEAYNKTRISIY